MLGYIETARKEGATISTGGKKWAESKGFYVEPTVIEGVTPDMTVIKEEVSGRLSALQKVHILIDLIHLRQIFGPVISVAKFTTEEEAIELANNSVYGLAAAVFTNDAKQSMRVSGALEAGTVWVNSYALLHVQAPFGGFKQSGIGRGKSFKNHM